MDQITETILANFRKISSIPRCSGNEEQIALWLKQWALSHGFSVKFDSMNNVSIGVPASEGRENYPPLVIQGHTDMVGEKTQASKHDFATDLIVPLIDGDWLRARDTTLGADNGIGIAIALAIAEDKSLVHPPLELLFTVDEETGLTGANALMPDFISGRILLNVDSEDEGVFTVGCAGGLTSTISMPLEYSTLSDNVTFFRLFIDGLAGGHSGVDIHENRANAIKLLAGTLNLIAETADLRISGIKGGSAHNAIPRYAEAVIAVPDESEGKVRSAVESFEAEVKSVYKDTDPSVSIKFHNAEMDYEVRTLDDKSSQRISELLLELPHGVFSMSSITSGLVETSNNIATVGIDGNTLVIMSSQRSSSDSGLKEITGKIVSVSDKYGAVCSHGSAYPPWQPDMDSPLLKQCRKVYTDVFGEEAEIEVIHAGLECAVIGSKYEGMDMISFGPTIQNPHSPQERLYIPSVRKVWDFMVALLASYDNKIKTA